VTNTTLINFELFIFEIIMDIKFFFFFFYMSTKEESKLKDNSNY
jgi:hypothetical protein